MIVIDASVLANVVGDDGPAGSAARARIAAATQWSAPDLIDVETVSVLRRRWRAGDLTARRFRSAVVDLLSLPIVRFPTGPLMIRAHELRGEGDPLRRRLRRAGRRPCVSTPLGRRPHGASGRPSLPRRHPGVLTASESPRRLLSCCTPQRVRTRRHSPDRSLVRVHAAARPDMGRHRPTPAGGTGGIR